jgi:hypothetical protein
LSSTPLFSSLISRRDLLFLIAVAIAFAGSLWLDEWADGLSTQWPNAAVQVLGITVLGSAAYYAALKWPQRPPRRAAMVMTLATSIGFAVDSAVGLAGWTYHWTRVATGTLGFALIYGLLTWGAIVWIRRACVPRSSTDSAAT